MEYKQNAISWHTMRISAMDIYCFILVLVPVLNIYMTPIPVLTLGEIILFILTGVLIGQKRINRMNYKNDLIIFLVYGVVITVISSMVNYEILTELPYKELAAFIIYFVLLFIISQRIDLDCLLKHYKKAAFVFAVFLIFQFAVHLLTGRWIPGMIPGLSSSYGRSTSMLIARMERASSVFKEPAHYAQYMAIPFVATLFEDKKSTTDKIYIIIYGLSLAFTISGNALLVIAVAIAAYMVHIGKTKGLLQGLFILCLSLSVIYFLTKSNATFASLISRIAEIEGNNASRYSGYVRVLRGYRVYDSFDWFAKIFGIGIGVYPDYSLHYAFAALTEKTFLELDYINGFQYYLVSVGIVGMFFYLKVFVKTIIFQEDVKKCYALIFIALILISGIYRGPSWLMFLIYICTNHNRINEDY